MATPPAKRRLLRPPLRIECARGQGRHTCFLGYGTNLSESGVFVQSLAPREPGTRLKLVMHFAGRAGPTIATEAEVRWSRGYTGKRAPSAGMGLRFVGMRPDDKSTIQALCSSPTLREAAPIPPLVRQEKRSDG
jgi:uncharacterized protein (TIGR02266 family)